MTDEITDEMLCRCVAQGKRQSEELLVTRYSRLVRICARPLFLFGGDGEDLIQEGMLGLLSAIREYDAQKGAAFRTFAEICIRNRLRSAIKIAAAGRHLPLNFYVSLEDALEGTEDRRQANPERVVIDDESLQERVNSFRRLLSAFEREVLVHYLDGQSYADIARATNRSAKSVDNAVQRLRRKLQQQLMFGDFSVS